MNLLKLLFIIILSINLLHADNSTKKEVSMYFQNMGLLVSPAPYKGFDRRAAVQHLIQHIQKEKYDIVALAEAFKDDERDKIAKAFPRMHRLDGPDGPWYDRRSDGGLLLLSRYPIKAKQKHEFVFPNGVGDDKWALKGIIHARVHIPGYRNDYDIFVTHLQNDDEGGRDTKLHVTLAQASMVQKFVERHTGKNNTAIIMGDFNLDGLKPNIASERKRRMKNTIDLWESCKSRGTGITHDKLGDFEPKKPHNPISNRNLATRTSKGERLDYFFLWSQNKNKRTCSCEVQVITQQFKSRYSKGKLRDMSDHYGLVYRFGIPKRNIAAVWRKTNKDTLIKRNYTKEKFYQLWTSMHSKGYHLEDFEFSNNLWHGIFKKGSGKYAMWRNFSHSAFDKKWREMSAKGYRLYDLETYVIDGKRKWAGLFKKGSGKYALWTNWSTSGFAKKRQSMAKKGMKLIDIEVYVVNNKLKWSGVWIKGKDGLLNRNYNYDAFKNLVQKRSRNGYKLIDIESYCINGKQKWAGIWEKSTDNQRINFDLNTNSFFPNQRTFSRVHDDYKSNGYELLDFESY